jgi:pSer/pThr/pTyr-binding forkhead associated (FHA) protein
MDGQRLSQEINIMVMSGVDDGTLLKRSVEQGDGQIEDDRWVITIGRHDSNDICLNNDTFVSRYHARLIVAPDDCWLEDRDSTNGTYIESPTYEDEQVFNTVTLKPGQLFRIGRTWLRMEPY